MKKIEASPHPAGRKVLSVVIEPLRPESEVSKSANPGPTELESINESSTARFGTNPESHNPGEAIPETIEEAGLMKPIDGPLEELDPEKLLSRIRETGIVGLGGAAFPTHVKLKPPKGKNIDTLIINGCECEPVLTADHRLMLEKTGGIIQGALIIARILGVENIIIAVESNKPDAVKQVKGQIGDDSIHCVVTGTRYPQGAEKILIKTILDREVPRGGLPWMWEWWYQMWLLLRPSLMR